ncbi:hypothetical protein [Streptomyces palmae]|uniref:WXG100 family type VII secretion target n=1 Tax=Streptomyces palmae TaxID=1701085 RepID=A0A4Z0H778_9ACTN|nr:hypothetical protein [Streptomyces palmae]TGB09434.1 hypothetical protein E4099_13735 [Streptomyces palmae]
MSEDFGEKWNRGPAGSAALRTGTRLDGGPGIPSKPGGPADFASSPTQKKEAAGTIEHELGPNTSTAAKHADEATSAAAKGFQDWDTAAGLKKVAETWDQQVKALMGRLAGEQSALLGAQGYFARNDIDLACKLHASQSKLNDYSTEGPRC